VNGDHDLSIVLAHHLVALIRGCRSFDVSTEDLRCWIREIPGPVGERVTCQVLVDATDVPLTQKIDHVALRLRSLTATGDDRDLVNAILSAGPSTVDLEPWRIALGVPSHPDDEPVTRHSIPDDWAWAWRWSAILPDEVLTEWRGAIQRVSEHHGEPSADAFDSRADRFQFASSESPYLPEELAELPVADAARLVSSWRPAPNDFWNVSSARELARTLQSVVAGDVRRWTENPGDVIALLREPVYVVHYLEALTEKASELSDRAAAVLDAIAVIPVDQWEPTPLGPEDGYSFEPTWEGLETRSNRLVSAFANTNGEIATRFDWAWDRAVATIHDHPTNVDLRDIMGDRDALNSAINRPWGIALETILALARWEAVHAGPLRPRFTTLSPFQLDLSRFGSVPSRP
jgi:hypothetical protein